MITLPWQICPEECFKRKYPDQVNNEPVLFLMTKNDQTRCCPYGREARLGNFSSLFVDLTELPSF